MSRSTWLIEEIVNISAFDGHSNGEEVIEISLSVESAQATGQLVWASIEEYDGTAITGSTVELVPQWDEIDISHTTPLLLMVKSPERIFHSMESGK